MCTIATWVSPPITTVASCLHLWGKPTLRYSQQQVNRPSAQYRQTITEGTSWKAAVREVLACFPKSSSYVQSTHKTMTHVCQSWIIISIHLTFRELLRSVCEWYNGIIFSIKNRAAAPKEKGGRNEPMFGSILQHETGLTTFLCSLCAGLCVHQTLLPPFFKPTNHNLCIIP